MDNELVDIILVFLTFVGGYLYGQYRAIDTMATKMTEDPEGFINLLRNTANSNRDELEFQRQGNMIYCYGKHYGFLAQAADFETLAKRIREILPDSEFIIPSDQKDFSTDELLQISKHLIIKKKLNDFN